MLSEDEDAYSVFTESGEEWLERMVETLQEGDYEKSSNLGYHESWNSINYKNGVVPEIHPEFGRLVEENEEPQYLIIRTHDESKDVTEKSEFVSTLPYDHPTYDVENFGQVRVYCEAVARGVEQFFVPITGWDGKNFHWITMPVVSNYHRSDGGTRKAAPLKNQLQNIDSNWVIHDEEVGEYNGRKVLTDYGMCWYDGEWIISESQIFDGP